MVRWVRAPFQWKGGELCRLPKGRGDAGTLKSRRGVLVSDHLGREYEELCVVNRKVRMRRLLWTLSTAAVAEVVSTLRAIATDSRKNGELVMVSSAHIFADVVAAFYSAIRQLVMRSREGEASLEALLHDLHISDPVKQKMWSAAADASRLETAEVTPHLERVVGEMHSSAWFSFSQSSVLTHTMKGTREALVHSGRGGSCKTGRWSMRRHSFF